LRKHFRPLDGMGVRDPHFSGDDLFILAGPTIVLDGEIRLFKSPGAKPLLAANRERVRFAPALSDSVAWPLGHGVNRAEAVCHLPPRLAAGKPSWLILYDAPAPDRKDGDHAVFVHLLEQG
jgi:Protein of unknown function (DUF3616)